MPEVQSTHRVRCTVQMHVAPLSRLRRSLGTVWPPIRLRWKARRHKNKYTLDILLSRIFSTVSPHSFRIYKQSRFMRSPCWSVCVSVFQLLKHLPIGQKTWYDYSHQTTEGHQNKIQISF